LLSRVWDSCAFTGWSSWSFESSVGWVFRGYGL